MKAKLLSLPFLALSLSACNMSSGYSKWIELDTTQMLTIYVGQSVISYSEELQHYLDVCYRTKTKKNLFYINVKYSYSNELHDMEFVGSNVSYSISSYSRD